MSIISESRFCCVWTQNRLSFGMGCCKQKQIITKLLTIETNRAIFFSSAGKTEHGACGLPEIGILKGSGQGGEGMAERKALAKGKAPAERKKPAFGEVIRVRRKGLELNQEELAARLGVSRNTVAGWETGHSRPDLATVPSLCRALKISLNTFFGLRESRSGEEKRILDKFFALNEGDREIVEWQMEMLAEKRAEQARREALTAKQTETFRRDDPAARRAEQLRRDDLTVKRPGPFGRKAPNGFVTVYASDLAAAAGIGSPLDEARGQEMVLLKDRETERADEVITVNGPSMEPTFRDGDRVLVEHTTVLRPGEIGIFTVDGEGFIKEYQPEGLVSHNPAYPVMRFAEEQEVRVIGRVIGTLKEEQLPTKEQLEELEED